MVPRIFLLCSRGPWP
uniref:CDS n=1 Tax=Macaca mulatta TaxID=9544 RepID=A0A7R9MW76_MACMU|nr:B14 [Macaca mulatta]